MIIGIEGGLGSGKTLYMAKCLHKDFLNGFNIQSNFGLNFEHGDLDVKMLMESSTELQNVSIGIDEMTVFVDCRRSASRMNTLLSYFILQTRKRSVNLYYTTQDLNMIDLRLYNHTHITVICEKLYFSNGEEIEDYRRYTLLDMRDKFRVKPKSFVMKISDFYDLYDTNEIIRPPNL